MLRTYSWFIGSSPSSGWPVFCLATLRSWGPQHRRLYPSEARMAGGPLGHLLLGLQGINYHSLPVDPGRREVGWALGSCHPSLQADERWGEPRVLPSVFTGRREVGWPWVLPSVLTEALPRWWGDGWVGVVGGVPSLDQTAPHKLPLSKLEAAPASAPSAGPRPPIGLCPTVGSPGRIGGSPRAQFRSRWGWVGEKPTTGCTRSVLLVCSLPLSI